MPTPWPVPLRVLFAGCAVYAALVAALSWGYTQYTGLSRWTMTPAGPALWYSNLLIINLAQWCGWAALAALVFTLGRRVPFGRARWRLALAFHVVASVVVATGHGVFVSTVRFVAQQWWGLDPAWWPSVTENFFRMVDSHVPIYWGLLGLQHAVDYHRQIRARDVAAAQLETRLVEAQLQALHRQVHPHFLFNTLHAISALLHRDPDTADQMIERLSDMLRVTLASVGVQQVPLRQELDFLRAYLDIEQLHFGPRLVVSMAIDPRTLDALVPNLVLQPLAENAVRHGLAPVPTGGTLEVAARVEGATLVLAVRDNGRGLTTGAGSAGHGVGLANTHARLEALYRGAASFEVRARSGGGTDAVIRVPFQPAALAEHGVERRAS